MSSLGSPNPFFIAGKKAYEVKRSLRFNRDDSAYLQATLGNSDVDKWTWSGWVKKTVNGQHQNLFSSGSDVVYTHINFDNSDRLRFQNWHSAQKGTKITTRVFRDNSAWMHIVAIWDSGNSTPDDRIRLYVNGTRETSFSSSSNPDQNQDSVINGNTLGGSDYGEGKHFIGKFADTSDNSGTYKTEINFIDGQAYDPSYFGQTDPLTGQWNPKKYTGGYGSNGFYLNFSDNSATTATTLGKDYSGNGNNFTPNNFSVAAGVDNDSVEDTPTNNWCTLNALHHRARTTTFSNGNLQAVLPAAASTGRTHGNFVVYSGKWYWEAKYTGSTGNFLIIGVCSADGNSLQRGVRGADGELVPNTGTVSVSFTTNDLIMVALDVDNGKWYIGKNGSYMLSGDPVNGTGFVHSGLVTTYNGLTPFFSNATSSGSQTVNINFGQQGFSYTPPTGFKALNSANLPDPTILLPNKHFDTLLYTGNGSTQSISGLNFAPDWVWIKKRDSGGSTNHTAFDAVRGATKYLTPNTTGAEVTDANSLTSFDSNGFTLGDYNLGNLNSSSLVSWNWNAGDTDGKTYTVTVVDDSGNKYRFDGFGTSAVTLDLAEGGTYIFNYPSAHPFRFSETADGTHGGGSEYTTGVTVLSSTSIQIVVAASAPNLNYYCSSHSGMGGAINTNSTLGSSNFDGSVQSLVKANPIAGISITRYTGTGSSITVGHGLGVTPQVTMTKKLTGTSNWTFLHTVYDGSYDRLYLNTSAAYANSAITPPTSTVFSRVASDVNNSGMICYCFSSVEGFSKIGFYKGNGNDSGTFVYCGFRPSWIMIKGRTGTRNWFIMDTKRDTFNLTENALLPNTNGAESTSTSYNLDILSNGFKLRKNNTQSNQNNIVYIFMAYAESPFKNARAR